MRIASCCALAVLVALAMAVCASSAYAVNYNPNTTIVIWVHGFDPDGYTRVGMYGDEEAGGEVAADVAEIALKMGRPTGLADPTAANQVTGCDYYGDTPPSWYTSADIAEDAALPYRVPKYAMRTAKFIARVLNRAPSATSVAIIGGSFGGEISRYMIEHDLMGLASQQKISRWIPVVGVVQGNWAASNIADWLAEALGGDSPDIDDMRYSWVDANTSAHATMNTALYGPMIITQYCATADGDGYITALCNDPNDGTNLVDDEKFSGYTTSAALHAATDGTLQMPCLAYQPTEHSAIADSAGMWAGARAAIENNKRVTMTMTRLKALTSADWWGGNGEYVFTFRVLSPMANTLYGCTDYLSNRLWSDGVSPLVQCSKNSTKYPNQVMFDQIVPPGETTLSVNLECYELDAFNRFYDMYEIGSTSTIGTFTSNVSASGNSVVTFSNSKIQIDITTAVRNVY